MLTTNFDPIFKKVQDIADKIKEDVESQLNEAFNTFEVMEHLPPQIDDPEHTFYRMKIKTDDNGHVCVKTIEKEPGKDFQVHIEEYDRGNKKALKHEKGAEAIKQ